MSTTKLEETLTDIEGFLISYLESKKTSLLMAKTDDDFVIFEQNFIQNVITPLILKINIFKDDKNYNDFLVGCYEILIEFNKLFVGYFDFVVDGDVISSDNFGKLTNDKVGKIFQKISDEGYEAYMFTDVFDNANCEEFKKIVDESKIDSDIIAGLNDEEIHNTCVLMNFYLDEKCRTV